MAATETDEIPIQGKLIAQKIIKSQLQIESLIQEIKKCDQDQSEMTKLNFSARKSILGIKSDLQVRSLLHFVRPISRYILIFVIFIRATNKA